MSIIDIYRADIYEEGTCNFCKRGKLNESGRLTFPYDEVIVLAGTQAKVNLCEDCFDKLRTAEPI